MVQRRVAASLFERQKFVNLLRLVVPVPFDLQELYLAHEFAQAPPASALLGLRDGAHVSSMAYRWMEVDEGTQEIPRPLG
jgi:hypothetical protein